MLNSMNPGDTVTLSDDTSGGASISGGGTIQVGVGGSVGSSTDIKLTRKEGEKVVITIKAGDHEGLSGSFGTTGIGVNAGGGSAEASSKTFSIDLSTPEGEAAYKRWAANPDHAPPPGPGVTMI